MIRVICGMAGSGKTTYVLNNKKEEDIILDLDCFKACFKNNIMISTLKELQINCMNFFLNRNIDIWYITCYPSNLELASFPHNTEFFFFFTNYDKCCQNIRKRDRKKPISAQEQLIYFNKKIQEKYMTSNIDFHILEVFESEERW